MVNKKWLAITLFGWLMFVGFSYLIPISTLALKLTWMALQQFWLIIGGLQSINYKGLFSLDAQQFLAGFKAGILLFFFNSILTYAVIAILNMMFGTGQVVIWLGNEREAMQQLFAVKDFHVLLVVFILVVIGAPISEEILFRGGLLLGFTEILKSWQANLLSALIFAAVHYYFVQFVPIFFSGLFLGRLFISEKKLIKPIVAHATVNLIGFIIYLYG